MTDSGLQRLIGVLVSPTKTFQALRERPTWIVALLAVLLVAGTVSQVAQSKVDPEKMIRGMVGDAVDEDQLQEMIERQEGQSPVVNGVVSVVMMGVILLFCALYFWLGTRLFGGEPTFKQSFATTVHAFVPWWGVKSLLSLPALLSRDELSVEETTTGVLPSNLGFLTGDEAPVLLRGLAASLDLFTLWGLFLLVLGFSVVARISKAGSGALAFVIWLVVLGLTLLPMVIPALVAGG